MRSHYGYASFFCQPGLEGAHEKNGVEGEARWFRRRHLVPLPDFASLAELNAYMATADAADDDRRITGRAETVGAAAARELPGLRALPEVGPFDPALMLSCRVDARARVCVRQSYYSVPARYAGRRLQVRLGATTVNRGAHTGPRTWPSAAGSRRRSWPPKPRALPAPHAPGRRRTHTLIPTQ